MTYAPILPSLHSLTANHGSGEPRTHNNGGQDQKIPRSSSSLASLIYFARNPIENVGQVVEDWYDGTTKEERARKQSLADRKQLLYLKMRMVSLPFLPKRAVVTNADGARLGYKSCRLESSSY